MNKTRLLCQILVVFAIAPLFETALFANGDSNMTSNELILSADSTFNASEYDKAREIFAKALEAAQKEGNKSNEVEANAMLGRCYLIKDDMASGMPYLKAAEQDARPEEPGGWSRYLGVRGRFEWQQKDLAKATETFKEMYDFCENNDLPSRAIDAAHMVAITGSPEQQIEWGKKGIAEAEKSHITHWLGPLWNNLGWVYEDRGNYPEALGAYLKAREYHWQYGTEQNKLIADWAVGHAYMLNGDYDNAGKWLRPVLAWAERIENTEFVGLSYRDLGEVVLAGGDSTEALSYFTNALDSLKKVGMPDWDADGYKKIVDKIASLKGESK